MAAGELILAGMRAYSAIKYMPTFLSYFNFTIRRNIHSLFGGEEKRFYCTEKQSYLSTLQDITVFVEYASAKHQVLYCWVAVG